VDAAHWDDKWDMDRLTEDSQDHLMATWGPGAGLRGLPFVTHGEGVHVFDSDGKKYLDWTSQAVCVNLGYDVPEGVVKAVNKQVCCPGEGEGGGGGVASGTCGVSTVGGRTGGVGQWVSNGWW
jgi:hypothetical protein